MLFGLFGNARAFAVAWRCCAPIFAGLGDLGGQRLAPTAFVDAYVLGFLQPILIEAVNEDAGGAVETEIWMQAMHHLIDRLATGTAQSSMDLMAVLSNPDHPQNANYIAGQREGNAYVTALRNRSEDAAERIMVEFRTYVDRSHFR